MDTNIFTYVLSDFLSRTWLWFIVSFVILLILVILTGIVNSKVARMEKSYYQQRRLTFFRALEFILILLVIIFIFITMAALFILKAFD
jgi:hypothetical protein